MDNALPITNALPISNALPANVLPQPPLSYSYAAPVYASCFPTQGCGEFILIVVLFILLIIVGAVCFCV
ncbi:YjcZ family sporulation protein [Bacillus salipaludis]|uniref:YjcZ family sporulation protein n=1 Tax=Bacillus salipaludis TaxID=2547811 RepID=A0A4R5VN42_9BACI|nr:YjcZ family sporulation protein [Bacillus salipaludis]TDK59503.1 YjcZ family sporulation protein [Bacillus salipaludis]